MYPNYTLPDLGFLRDDRLDLEQVFLTPWRFSPGWTPLTSPTQGPATTDQPQGKRHRPHSCADIDHLRKKGNLCFLCLFCIKLVFLQLNSKRITVKFKLLKYKMAFRHIGKELSFFILLVYIGQGLCRELIVRMKVRTDTVQGEMYW